MRLSFPRPRAIALIVILVLATLYFGRELNRHEALREWAFWHYARAWLAAWTFVVSSLVAGHTVVDKLALRGLRLGERLLFDFTIGAFVFGLGVFFFGLLGLLHPVFFAAWPALILGIGGRRAYRFASNAYRHRRAMARARPSPWRFVALAYGVLCVGLLYIQILAPDALHFDARWYHMPMAEHYASSGSIRRFPEGWFPGAGPQFVSYLYTWAFLMPGVQTFDKIEACLHIELLCFLSVCLAVPVLVARLIPKARMGWSWSLYFLFPGLFLYDSNLSGAVDHISSIWVIPAALSLGFLSRDFDRRWCILFAAFLSALLISKFSCYAIVSAFAAAFTCAAIWSLGKRAIAGQRVAPVLWGAAVVVGGGLVFTSVQWLKNLVFYRDPLFPLLHAKIHPNPWTADADGMYAAFTSMPWSPEPGALGWKNAARAMITFSFEPHDWPYFHHDVPVFGSLFTLTSLTLPFLPGAKRIWPVVLGSMWTVFWWYRVNAQDRYLQSVLPLMVASTVATLVLLWRQGVWVRAAIVPLVGLQLIWSGDIPFIATHNLIGNDSALRFAASFLESGFKKAKNRFRVNAPWGELGEGMPSGSKVLIHESPVHLGIRAASVNDQWQSGLSYRLLGKPSAIYDQLKSWGVTHIAWETGRSHANDTIGGDLLFFDFVMQYAQPYKQLGWLYSAKMPAERPNDAGFRDTVAVLPCYGPFTAGYFHVADLARPETNHIPRPFEMLPRDRIDVAAIAARAGYVDIDQRCHASTLPELDKTFLFLATRGEERLYARRR